jgi:hypothetical protein
MAHHRPDDDLAYGSYYEQGQSEGEGQDRGFIGDVGKRLFGGGGRRQDQPVSASPLYACPQYRLGPTLLRCTPAVASVPCRVGCSSFTSASARCRCLSLSIVSLFLSFPARPHTFSLHEPIVD